MNDDSLNLGEVSELVPEVAAFGIRAFTTTRQAGSFGLATDEPARSVLARWSALRRSLEPSRRLATASQVHGAEIIVHRVGWEGWLRGPSADGHLSIDRGTALAVTVADCVPVFITHPSGAVAVLHSGWRGTALRIVQRGIELFVKHGFHPAELYVHAGPSICGQCYEVGGDVYAQLTGTDPGMPKTIDLRALIADHARTSGARNISVSSSCTRCDHERFYSHRAGDDGRQLGVILADD
jgi:purine-nucleoside/S-methyl-5'-thioadenosine phosphorylase / adenosine deaminase